jgi:hypothetical protein
MPQLFHRSTNTLSRLSVFGAAFFAAAGLGYLAILARSPLETGVNQPVPQPIEFSHRHHVGDVGFDCRYCHATAEQSPFAGMPTSATCMHCHTQIWAQSPKLEVLRQSVEAGVPIAWNRVYDLPDFTYFDHRAHVLGGFGCETCHGRVDRMSEIWQAEPLLMTWCLDCHRDPAQYVRPREAVYVMGYEPRVDQAVLGPQLAAEYGLQAKTDCTVCHR